MPEWTFAIVAQCILMPAVSVFGLIGNSFSIYILNKVSHIEIKPVIKVSMEGWQKIML